MKKLSIICSVILALALVTTPAFAQTYRIDILEAGNPGGWGGASLKTFDDPAGLDVLAAGAYSYDVWLTGAGALGVNPTAGGAFMPFGAGVTVTDVKRYNNDPGELPGPWQAGAGVDSPAVPTPGPATALAIVAELSVGAAPDVSGDLIVCRVDFTCDGAGKVAIAAMTVPATPTWGPNPPWVDAAIIPAASDICQVDVCTLDSECDDLDQCNGVETCVIGITNYCGYTGNTCQPGTPPACDDGVGCTDDTCDTVLGCVYTAVDANCPADTVCADNSCDAVLDCVVAYSTAECRPSTNQCDAAEFCTGSDPDCPADVDEPNGTPCDDGTYCTAVDECDGGACVGTGDPCDDSNTCTDDTCNEGTANCTNVCNATSAVDPCCEDPICEPTDICQSAGVINIGSWWANCGDVGVKIDLCLENAEIPIGGLQIDICENLTGVCSVSTVSCTKDSECPVPGEVCDITADPDCLTCVECELTERSVMFDCVVSELPNGCCRVILFAKHPGGLINPGECNVVRIVYELSDAPECCDTCIPIGGTGIVLSDEYGYDVGGVVGDLGEICPYVCGDVWPEESAPGAGDCGDSVIDIFDILEEVDIALNDDADACQAGPRSDVPTGTPPYCLDPDGVVNILDVMVIIDMVLDRQDCCSYWYAGIIY